MKPLVLVGVGLGAGGALCLVAMLVISRATTASPLVATIPIGLYPSALVVDSRVQRALVLNTFDTTVSMLDEEHGTMVATTTVGTNGGAHPQAVAFDSRTGHAFVLTDDGQLSMLNARSGRVLRTVMLGGTPSAIAVDEEQARAFVAMTDGGTVAAIDTRTGALVRTVTVGHYPTAIVYDRDSRRMVVANAGDATLSIIAAPSGQVVQTVRLMDVPATLVVSERHHEALITTRSGIVEGIDLRTGVQRFRRLIFPHVNASDALAITPDDPSGVLIVTYRAELDELAPYSGHRIRVLHLPGNVAALAVNPVTGDVVVVVREGGDARGRVVIVKPHGHVMAMLPVGVDPSALAVDPSNRRILVVSTNLHALAQQSHPTPPLRAPLAAVAAWLRGWLPGLAPSVPPHATRGSVYVLRLDDR